MARVRLVSADLQDQKRIAVSAKQLASNLPLIVMEARRASAAVLAGLHGRRRAGQGENFWQYRPFMAGEAPGRIDWRRSARYDSPYFVREREWEAAHTIHLFIDQSTSMQFVSDLALASKSDAAMVLGLALAECLVRSGERVGLMDLVPPTSSTAVIERFAEALLTRHVQQNEQWPQEPLPERTEAVLISDCLIPIPHMKATLDRMTLFGSRGHVLRIADPVELTFPFTGDIALSGLESKEEIAIGDAVQWQKTYLAHMAEHLQSIATVMAEKGWSFSTHDTSRQVTSTLLRLANRIITQ